MASTSQKVSMGLKTFFVFALSCYFLNFNVERPRVLILHSYALDYNWSRQVNEGIMRILKGRTDFSLHWQYMDTKNHPSVTFKQKAGLLARRMINRLRPQVIIAIDDDAQDFAGNFYVDHPDIKIVFAGVNGELRDYSYDNAHNVTGILERLPLDAVKDTIPFLVNTQKPIQDIKIINLGDTSGTVRRDEGHILSYDWAPLNLIDSVLVDDFEEWKRAVLSASERCDCLFITNYRQLYRSKDNHKFVPPGEVMKWTVQNAKVPILGGNGFVVEDGAYLAVAASPYEQGETAAKLALKILAGQSPFDLPITQTKHFLVYMRGGLSDKRPRVPKIYEAFARGTGKMYEN